jgi:hypothetical protein
MLKWSSIQAQHTVPRRNVTTELRAAPRLYAFYYDATLAIVLAESNAETTLPP